MNGVFRNGVVRCAVACFALGGSAAAADKAVDRQARVWAASCAACHGGEVRSRDPVPALAGRKADALMRILLEFKTGQRPAATVMPQHTKGYTDDELQRIAQFYAAQPAR
jgi:cytochrome c553